MSDKPKSRRRSVKREAVNEVTPPTVEMNLPAAVIAERPEPATTRKPHESTPNPTLRVALGSWGNASIDQHNALFVAASDAVQRKKGVRVNPRVIKAMMGVESGENGNYPVDRCRPYDGHSGPLSCGPMQIKWPNHEYRCRECDKKTLAGHIELAAHIIGDTMKQHGCDEYEAYTRAYLTADDINGTSQQEAVAGLKRRVAQTEKNAGPVITPTPEPEPKPPLDPMRPMPYPKMVDLIVQKPYERAGFDRVAFRGDRIVGVADHITQGDASIEWYRDFFSTGGERARDALVDVVIGRDGRIGLLNDPRDPQRGGTRAGWANGGNGGPSGIGVAFRRRFPLINDVLWSKEHVARVGQALTDAQIEASAQLTAAVAHNRGVVAATFPEDPRHGVNVSQYHDVLSAKPGCPGGLFLEQFRPLILREAKRIMAAWQGYGATIPDPEPITTYTDLGFTLADIEGFFGTARRTNADGTTDTVKFNPVGEVSLLWLARCEEQRVFPAIERIWTSDAAFVDGKEVKASFVNGWVAYQPLAESRAAWQWLDQAVTP